MTYRRSEQRDPSTTAQRRSDIFLSRMLHTLHTNNSSEGLISLDAYRRAIGRSKTSLWRYRQNGWLPTVNILGRLYLKRSDILAFEAAAAQGLLAQDPHGCAAREKSDGTPAIIPEEAAHV